MWSMGESLPDKYICGGERGANWCENIIVGLFVSQELGPHHLINESHNAQSIYRLD